MTREWYKNVHAILKESINVLWLKNDFESDLDICSWWVGEKLRSASNTCTWKRLIIRGLHLTWCCSFGFHRFKYIKWVVLSYPLKIVTQLNTFDFYDSSNLRLTASTVFTKLNIIHASKLRYNSKCLKVNRHTDRHRENTLNTSKVKILI